MSAQMCLLHPSSPLVFRSGRPFGADTGGTGAEAVGFPTPATIAGAIRAAYVDATGRAPTEPAEHDGVRRALTVHGPFLVAVPVLAGTAARLPTCFVPKPSDAVYLRDGESYRVGPVKPAVEQRSAEGSDLPEGLTLAMLDDVSRAKPAEGPAFWSLHEMAQWQRFPVGEPASATNGLPHDIRTHVTIQDDTLGHEEGRLFRSTGLDFAPRWKAWRSQDEPGHFEDHAWALGARLEWANGVHPAAGFDGALRRVGADGRSATIELLSCDLLGMPDDLGGDLCALGKGGLIRLTLATPAIFAKGWLPGWLHEASDSKGKRCYRGRPAGLDPQLELELVAAALGRWQPYSGWSMERSGKFGMRAVRRMVPAGSVYWFRIRAGSGADVAALWLHPVSDDEQDRRDGFGLALPGVGAALNEELP